MIEKTLLVYGDSLSWGIVPGTRHRRRFEKRWPGILQQSLGNRFRVVEDCLNGRTTAFEHRLLPGRNGAASLLQSLECHFPLDLIIFMLGVNDFQRIVGVTAWESAQGLAKLIDVVRLSKPEPTYDPPGILVISPPVIAKPVGTAADKFLGAEQQSPHQGLQFEEVAARKDCFFLDASQHIAPSDVDGVHLDEDAHERLAEAALPVVEKILALEENPG